MASIKYSVWFHGNEDEPEGICYSARKPYFVDSMNLAKEYKEILQSTVEDPSKFSVCMIVVDDVGG